MQWYMKVMRQYADFNGRARRTEFWMYALFAGLISIAAVIIDVIISAAIGGFVPIFIILVSLAHIIPGLAVTVRRLHDTDRSGGWWFIQLVPFGSIVLLVFECTEGNPYPNQYGPNPKLEGVPPNPQQPYQAGPTFA